MTRFKDLCIDVSDAREGAAFLAPLLGLDVVEVGPDSAELADDVAEHTLWVNVVPEPRTVKNRVHWDVDGSTSDLLAAGATLLRARDEEIGWDQLLDVEGNEFCVFAPEDE